MIPKQLNIEKPFNIKQAKEIFDQLLYEEISFLEIILSLLQIKLRVRTIVIGMALGNMKLKVIQSLRTKLKRLYSLDISIFQTNR